MIFKIMKAVKCRRKKITWISFAGKKNVTNVQEGEAKRL